ncbi:prefoldin subunit 4 [Skeletonema marinoi]|uniref:Prefoldin subunit 4 n=1 Tax=Skeletonema marinoi TaxID=267567 RepID=A0A6V0ZXN8_9STRA|nr:prefoldin subunit 4 [Skeletonema marinoi]|mmetsp:Transcript_4779/g.10051  ORF Transcript_4779/g.10051 Transcript_4779/m.10051 type:complete len:134 (+) Transcript_4779:114-515(+)|eukprot:CAMPEP_0113388748 /NCGR_PEP_ID=MMETSP0013_2-20120614/9248_1 /TAXON_ID=2843 ORGANISM="Skeletonema costatum, Strain 1716" /NCGR_SAMPLE_ID=MMETSP0013_2 /ASSEMBLY_ACC=CAM_ASM_000158 /LENGTH=133 /DNA_ID=CAMNT_0000271757 /DNA_START=92 /DNA_END=493 /DNA_ORIENTATION=+ /assembly_acc=CAM_ASM_000158
MPEANGMILSKEEENDNEVRREDQDAINEFGRLNARLDEVKRQVDNLKKTLEKIDDASTELMMGDGDAVMLSLGGAMFEATEDEATEYCEAEVERQQKILDKLSEEEAGIVERQETLKKLLYGRFGKSINLEA